MSQVAREDDQVFDSFEDEAVYWKNRSKAFEAQVTQLQAQLRQSKRLREGSLEDDHEKDLVKKMRMENFDPFFCFPYHCTQIILNHLDGMDLYKMTKVSREWKMAVESDKVAGKKLENTLTLDVRNDRDLCLKPLNDVEYKHLTVESNVLGKNCINRFSSTIENLQIYYTKTNSMFRESLKLTFPNLTVLTVADNKSRLFESFSNCKFPVLNRLMFHLKTWHEEGYEINDRDTMEKTLASMPNLKHISVFHQDFPIEYFKEQLIKLESLRLESLSAGFIEAFASSTLQKLFVYTIFNDELELIFSQMKNLKSFESCGVYCYPHKEKQLSKMSTNTSITSLSVHLHEDKKDRMLLIMLKALTSLKKLRYNGFEFPSLLDFVVHNNLKMRKIFIHDLSNKVSRSINGALKKYEEFKVKEADNDQINTCIEFVDQKRWQP